MTLYFADDILVPEHQHFDDAGADLKTDRDIEIAPKDLVVVHTGVKAEIPYGYVGLLKGRSSLESKGLIALGGVIDSGYRGEIKAILLNVGNETLRFKKGDRVVQLIGARIDTTFFLQKGEPETETDRGDNGFGSTGLRNGKYSLGVE